ncbi:HNH/ENDO VII family nuclease [Succinivibrio dextrinosolvens]|uniref:HNH/ENDO VII family nuclease n=1 Tax=Succinivibrio dextrinosolvens TaxID=83771 RepID=UPI001922797D|nr:HNH/ENDO VII family nuclease [Succinivibrio dextrinosolvens]
MENIISEVTNHKGIKENNSPNLSEINLDQKNNYELQNGEIIFFEKPDLDTISTMSHKALLEQSQKLNKELEINSVNDISVDNLTEDEKNKIKEETGWSDVIIDNIKNMQQYEVLKKANLIEAEINGRPCLIKENINLDYKDSDGISNRQRMERGLAPLDSETGKPIELHHLGQKEDSPLVELTEEEHRTGEYEDGKKNQTLWHDNTTTTEVHYKGNNWDIERKNHWKSRAELDRGTSHE